MTHTSEQSASTALPPLVETLQQRRCSFDDTLKKSLAGDHGTLVNHVIVLADYFWELHCSAASLPLGAALLFDRQQLWLTNNAFVTALLVTRWCQQQGWHPRPAKSLICAALTQDLGLGQLAQQGYLHKTLSPQQRQRWQQHPSQTLRFLHQLGVRNRLWLQTIAEHQELLDGSGYPKQKSATTLATTSRLVALTGRLAELLSPRQWRKAYSIPQALRHLADRPHQYDPRLLDQLAQQLLPYLPGSLLQLENGQRAIVHQEINAAGMVAVQDLHQGALPKQLPAPRHVAISQIHYLFAPQPWGHTTLANQLWSQQWPEPGDDEAEQTQGLKPDQELLALLTHLQQDHVSKAELQRLLASHPSLGELLTRHLNQRFPQRQIRDAEHAVLMFGAQQSVPLLLQLALLQRLERYQFPALSPLRRKVRATLELAALLATENSQLLPTQASMFTLLNLAPLYLEPALQNSLPPRQPALDGYSLASTMSLMGCRQTREHLDQVAELARQWHQSTVTDQAIALISHDSAPNIDTSPMALQLIAVFEASILLTHHTFHGRPLNDPQLAPRLLPALKRLGIGKAQLQEILQQFCESHPFCEL